MQIRPFGTRDQTDARSLILRGLGEHFGHVDESLNPDIDDIQGHYPGRGHLFFVAEDGGEIVGTAGVFFESKESARIVRMSVRKDRRRRGIAAALLDRAIGEARARGVTELLVFTEPHWPDAVGLYRNAGFEEFGRDDVDIHMKKDIRNEEAEACRRSAK